MRQIKVLYPGEKEIQFSFDSELEADDLLEVVFANFNSGSNRESVLFMKSKIRSMSSNDFVCIDNQWYLCKPIGWQAVEEQFVIDFDAAVRNHPKYNANGSWRCAMDVARKMNQSIVA